jgi:hypothetical protein
MAGHYASADVGRLLKLANLVLNRQETCTVLLLANAGASVLWTKGPADLETASLAARNSLKSGAPGRT